MPIEPVAAAATQPASAPFYLGLPKGSALSPSRASDFLTCPLLFRYRAIDRIPEQPGLAQVRGTLVHAVLEDLFDLPNAQRTLDACKEMLKPTWERLIESDPRLVTAFDSASSQTADDDELTVVVPPDPQEFEEWINSAEQLLETYFRLEDPTRLQPRYREFRMEVTLDEGQGPPLRGIIDRIDIAGDLVRVVDYKTGRSPGPGFEQKAMFQMHFYALMIWRLKDTIPKRLQLLYLGDEQVLYYEPTETDLLAFEKKLRALWKAITDVAASGEWKPRPSKMCKWCDHHSRCPEQGGVIPELPTQLVIDVRG